MKSLLSSKPVLWFLFLFNLVVAAVAPFVVDGAQGVATSVGMGVVSLGAGVSLLRGSDRRNGRPSGRQSTQQSGQRQSA
ncbi:MULTISPECIES: hypothetical protein [unclassified Streptomyces]|uniref:hypothetical protein n=1 Tax=unclassified Streptomyces TaxID=2593676 RepID=UPI002E2C99A0|nr:hypothetical protein [Streptomyces sp. NBC_01429]